MYNTGEIKVGKVEKTAHQYRILMKRSMLWCLCFQMIDGSLTELGCVIRDQSKAQTITAHLEQFLSRYSAATGHINITNMYTCVNTCMTDPVFQL